MGKFKNLVRLDVSFNDLESLRDIQNMRKLKLLDATDNRLTKVDEAASIKSLEYLFIGFNQITDLPDLKAHPKLKSVIFGYNLINQTEAELREKLPNAYLSVKNSLFKSNLKEQNINYTIDFMEPSSIELISTNTTKISGRVHMPVEKIQITLDENLNDDDEFKTEYFANVDENGYFVFENLNFKRFAGGKCDLDILMCFEYNEEYKQYTGRFLRSYQLR